MLLQKRLIYDQEKKKDESNNSKKIREDRSNPKKTTQQYRPVGGNANTANTKRMNQYHTRLSQRIYSRKSAIKIRNNLVYPGKIQT